MFSRKKVPFFVALLAALLSTSGLAYTYQHPAARDLHERIAGTWSLADDELASSIEAITGVYLALPLSEISSDDRIELGYELQAWRRDLGAKLLTSVENAPDARAAVPVWRALAALRPAADKAVVEKVLKLPRVAEAIGNRDRSVLEPLVHWLSATEAGSAYRDQIESWGFPEVAKTTGPGAFVSIHPVAHSPWPFARWAELAPSDKYSIESSDSGDEVVYRGMRLRTGDVALVFQAIDRDGLFTSFTSERAYLSHVAIFVLVNKDGKKIPTMFEMHELGVRGLPLSVELSSQMVSYAEVYRLKEASPRFEERLQSEALHILEESQRFDFSAVSGRDDAMACPGLPACLWRRAGEKPIEGQTQFNPEAMKNFSLLGLKAARGLTPNDYAQSARLQLKGWIDNGNFEWNLARAITREAMGKVMRSQGFDPARLPLSFKLRRFAIDQIQRGTPLGTFMRQFTQFSRRTFPSGPPGVVSISRTMEASVNKLVRAWWSRGSSRCGSDFGRLVSTKSAGPTKTFSYHDFLDSAGGRDLLNNASTQLRDGLGIR